MGLSKAPDRRRAELEVFLGKWRAEGTSFGGTDHSGDDSRANGVPCESEHEGHGHTGGYFLVEDETARPGGEVFDTLSIKGLDPETGRLFARTFENHGFHRNYALSRDGDLWTLTGETERAKISFSDGNRRQTIVWEWKPSDQWLPLCDQTAIHLD